MLNYEISGSGKRTLVFLHGFGGSRLIWRQQVEAFAPVARCIAIDLPGHGDSAWAPFTLTQMAEQVKDILQHEQASSVHVVASSFGGLVALEIWRSRPDSFSAMTLAGSTPRFTACDGFPAGLDVPKIRKLAGQLEGSVSLVLDMFFRSLLTRRERESGQGSRIKDSCRASKIPDREALLVMLDILEQADLRDVFRAVDAPLQIVAGDGDYLCPPAVVEVLQTMKPSARIDVFKDAGHFPFFTFPDEFNRALKEFVGL